MTKNTQCEHAETQALRKLAIQTYFCVFANIFATLEGKFRSVGHFKGGLNI